MSTKIDIYPKCPTPSWMEVGVEVEVLGEGMGTRFIISEIQNCRAVVVPIEDWQEGYRGGCWESFTKIYRPGHQDEDYALTHPNEGRNE